MSIFVCSPRLIFGRNEVTGHVPQHLTRPLGLWRDAQIEKQRLEIGIASILLQVWALTYIYVGTEVYTSLCTSSLFSAKLADLSSEYLN